LSRRQSKREKLKEILRQAAVVFCERGYHQASVRDIARATGVSLAGLYYYFSSKERLLYLIQQHAFETILAQARAALAVAPADPEERLRIFILLHLKYFLTHPNEMKVLTHEERALADKWRRGIHAIKKAYYQLCFDEVEALRRAHRLAGLDTRVAALSLFGMMNWIYTWYNVHVDPDADELARQMTQIFLRGAAGAWAHESGESETARERQGGPRKEELIPVTL
jgi:AcrR family transcriptional regulator